MTGQGTRPEDVLPDDQDFTTIQGVRVRKGTIFAALKNIELLQSGDPELRAAALKTLRELAPALVVLDLHRHFQCRDPEVEQLIADAAEKLEG